MTIDRHKFCGTPRWARSVSEEQHANQNERGGNCIPYKVHPMDALTATKAGVFVIAIKTIPALFHLTNQPRQKFKLELKDSIAARPITYRRLEPL